ncbi:enoyl-CoA hydratase [Mesorhizobium australicum]|uniref:Short chain enoyl-CoA hydratase n=1 Tax=Mesorhizobium australicum TaxID=536018 RepID=A0A1X7PTK2_9HYPH|nr:enoyl-CoA hydratase [Mesorhizobium australicum]SMH54760.1 short chain enoyl-CoA hydratase [Mesorhizobium australicum]
MDETPLLIEIADGVATLTLNRPAALNSLNRALRTALVATLAEMDARDDVRVIILTGTGRAFCAGLDVKELGQSGHNVTENVDGGDMGSAITGLRKPIIAAINGLAVTGGFEITLACDIVLAARSAFFQDTHAKIGLLPGWGLSQRLSRAIGPYRAKEISLSARRVPAEEAAALGFVTRVVADDDLLPAARAVALAIARWPADHIGRIKSLIDRGYEMPLGEALRFEAEEARASNAQVTLPTRS